MSIRIHHRVSPDRRKLTLEVGEVARNQLLDEIEDAGRFANSDVFLHDTLEHLVRNSDLQWVDPSETGDLTDAPMLGLRDADDNVTERWAYMDYQVKSLVHELAKHGEVTLVS